METNQIEFILTRALHGTGTVFLGVFPSDKLPPPSPSHPSCLVANTDPSSKPGQHWVAFYYETPKIVEFFDSFGMHPKVYGFNLDAYLHHVSSLVVQSISSNVCGQYCIFFLYHRCRKQSLHFIQKSFLSCGPTTCTDRCVKRFVDHLITHLGDKHYLSLPHFCTAQSSCCKEK